MARESIIEALGDIAREKGIAQERLVEVIQEAVTAAAKRKYKNFEDIEARINPGSGELEVFRYKTVTENLVDPDNEIPLEEARRLDSLAEPGDEVEYEIDNQELSRVIAQTARQLIFQKIREAERETIFENFKDRKGEILNGIVSRTERGRVYVTFNQTEAILYAREQIPHERFSSGEHVRVMLLDVLNDPKEPSQLVISRGHPLLLIKLFEMEVPEIYDGIVEIVAAAREPGHRAKIAVRSNDSDVDPVGACVGVRGSRVQAIISELRGEKIDIINYREDLPSYVANAMAPAELTRFKIDEENREIQVEVEPDQLSMAIGRQGQNVRLASKLLDYKINVSAVQEKTLSLEEQIRERLLATQADLAGMRPDAGAEEGSGEGGTELAAGAELPSAPETGAVTPQPAAEGEAGAAAVGETATPAEGIAGDAATPEPAEATEVAGPGEAESVTEAVVEAPEEPEAATTGAAPAESSETVAVTEEPPAESPMEGQPEAQGAAPEPSETSGVAPTPEPSEASEVAGPAEAEPLTEAAVEAPEEPEAATTGAEPAESSKTVAVTEEPPEQTPMEEEPEAQGASPREETSEDAVSAEKPSPKEEADGSPTDAVPVAENREGSS
ncbi:MAG: transcription termination factor NusA [SAR324 cluster bacterium]|nr:transcription termination factor NusA [SAR324 cluster bacterium]